MLRRSRRPTQGLGPQMRERLAPRPFRRFRRTDRHFMEKEFQKWAAPQLREFYRRMGHDFATEGAACQRPGRTIELIARLRVQPTAVRG